MPAPPMGLRDLPGWPPAKTRPFLAAAPLAACTLALRPPFGVAAWPPMRRATGRLRRRRSGALANPDLGRPANHFLRFRKIKSS